MHPRDDQAAAGSAEAGKGRAGVPGCRPGTIIDAIARRRGTRDEGCCPRNGRFAREGAGRQIHQGLRSPVGTGERIRHSSEDAELGRDKHRGESGRDNIR